MKDAKGHGSNGKGGMPIPGHEYHTKTDAQLRYIAKDASEAEKATRGMSAYNPTSGKREDTAGKYSDQVNNAASVLAFRARGGADLSAANELARGSQKSDAVPVHPGATGPRGVGVDGFGMTPEEAGAHVAAGRMSSPPLGVYADKATHDRYRAAAGLPAKKF